MAFVRQAEYRARGRIAPSVRYQLELQLVLLVSKVLLFRRSCRHPFRKLFVLIFKVFFFEQLGGV